MQKLLQFSNKKEERNGKRKPPAAFLPSQATAAYDTDSLLMTAAGVQLSDQINVYSGGEHIDLVRQLQLCTHSYLTKLQLCTRPGRFSLVFNPFLDFRSQKLTMLMCPAFHMRHDVHLMEGLVQELNLLLCFRSLDCRFSGQFLFFSSLPVLQIISFLNAKKLESKIYSFASLSSLSYVND